MNKFGGKMLVSGILLSVASMSYAQNCGGRNEPSCSSQQHRNNQHAQSYNNSASYRASHDYATRAAQTNSARHGERHMSSSSPAVNNSGRRSGKGSASRQ